MFAPIAAYIVIQEFSLCDLKINTKEQYNWRLKIMYLHSETLRDSLALGREKNYLWLYPNFPHSLAERPEEPDRRLGEAKLQGPKGV